MGKKRKHETGFGARLAKLLNQRGLSQKQAAHHAGVTPSVLSGWLNGTSTPSDVLAVQRLCRTLSEPPHEPVSFEELLTGSKNEAAAIVSNESDLAKLFVHENELFNGYIHLKATKVSLKKK